MKVSLEGVYSFDSSILLEMLAGTDVGQQIERLLEGGKLDVYSSHVNLAEAEYILCRKIGYELAQTKVRNLIDSNFIDFISTEQLLHIASKIKCEYAIALADCFCLAVAETTGSTALFRFKEKELEREIGKKPFEIRIKFLEEMF